MKVTYYTYHVLITIENSKCNAHDQFTYGLNIKIRSVTAFEHMNSYTPVAKADKRI